MLNWVGLSLPGTNFDIWYYDYGQFDFFDSRLGKKIPKLSQHVGLDFALRRVLVIIVKKLWMHL